MPKSFCSRTSRGNLKLDQCKFVALDEVDDIYDQDRDGLSDILHTLEKSNANIITCSATMKKDFMDYYKNICPDFVLNNMNQKLEA